MSNKEVKEETETVPEEVEEVSKKVAEEVAEEAQAVDEELKQKDGIKFVNITKLKCNYTTYKNERAKLKMPFVTECEKCMEKFKNGDDLYSAYKINSDIKQSYLICKKCAK